MIACGVGIYDMSFLKTSGTQFTLDGQLFFIFGCTVYDTLYYDRASSGILTDIKNAAAAGFNTIRFTNYLFQAADTGIEFQDPYWQRIDYALDLCRQYNLKVILELTDIFGVFHIRNTWANSGFMTDTLNFCNWLPNRVNTVNGRTYKNDDTIAMYSIAGELGEPLALPTGNRPFYTTVASYLRAQDTNHLICPGAQNPEQIYDASYWQTSWLVSEDILTDVNADCAATEGYYGQYNEALFYPFLFDYTKKRNKPWFIIEFGFDQNFHCDPDRASEYKFVFQTGLKNGCAGFIFWNLGPEGAYNVGPQTPETWQMIKIFAKTKAYNPRLLVI